MNICCPKCVQEIDTDTVDACHVVILTRYGMVSVGGQNEAYSQVQTSLQPWKWDSLKTLVNSEIQITLTSKFCTKHNQVQPQTWFKRYRWYKVILNFRSLDLYNMQIPGAILWTSHPSILKIHVLEQLDIRWQCILSGKQGRIYFHIALEWFLFYFSSRSVKMAHKRNTGTAKMISLQYI